MTILNKILRTKRLEIARLKTSHNQELVYQPSIHNKPTLKEQIKNSNHVSIIAEIKRASPSKGEIAKSINLIQQAKTYEKEGAVAISVLTDQAYFKGSLQDLREVSEAVEVPVLCKDFIIDRLQIDYARAAGAQIILLIVAALQDKQLYDLYNYATSKDLEVLVEVHHLKELERAIQLNAPIIGINNRNLKNFQVDLQTTNHLSKHVTDPNTIIVSESGIQSTTDVEQVTEDGARAILVGETLMRSNDLSETFQQLQIPLCNGKDNIL